MRVLALFLSITLFGCGNRDDVPALQSVCIFKYDSSSKEINIKIIFLRGEFRSGPADVMIESIPIHENQRIIDKKFKYYDTHVIVGVSGGTCTVTIYDLSNGGASTTNHYSIH